MSPEEWIAKERKRFERIKKGIPLAKAVIATNSMQTDRIFGKGLKSDGSPIGGYNSTDPLYVNPNKAPRKFQPKGKTGKTKFKSGKPHVTKWFSSYKSFRSTQGRQTNKVDLVLSGNLRSDYATPPQRVEALKYVAGVARQENGDKIAGAERRFGRIFALTRQETEFFVDTLAKESFD